jgi:hypothetical protein
VLQSTRHMPYESVDQLQKVLVEKVFHYAKDSKKAAGRALGTLVEIITFYLLSTDEGTDGTFPCTYPTPSSDGAIRKRSVCPPS